MGGVRRRGEGGPYVVMQARGVVVTSRGVVMTSRRGLVGKSECGSVGS